MRLLTTVNCMLLACIATSMASDYARAARPKRDLLYLKNLIASKLFGASQDNITSLSDAEPVPIREEGDVKIYRIPGFDNILVKAVPKAEVEIVETAVPISDIPVAVNPAIGIVESYLGTKTPDETLSALQGIKNLLQSGILLEPKPIAVFPGPPRVPLIPVIPPPLPIPQPLPIFTEIIPVEPVKPVHVPRKFSYEQINDDGTVVKYAAKNNGEVVVTETNVPPPLPPPYIMERIKKICWKVPVGTLPIPTSPPLSPIQRPVVYDVPYGPVGPFNRPPQFLEAPVEVDPYYYKPFGERAEVIVHEPIMMPPPPTYIVDRIEKVAAAGISPKVTKAPSGYAYKVVNNGYQEAVLFEPQNQRYAFRHVNQYTPSQVGVVNVKPRFDAKGGIPVRVSENSGRYMYPTRPWIEPTPGTYSHKQVHAGTTHHASHNPVLVTGSINTMPYPPQHIIKRIETVAATAHATQLPKVPAGYSYKMVNNKPLLSFIGYPVPTPIQSFKLRTDTKKIDKPSVSSIYSYKHIKNDGTVTTHSERTKENTAFASENIKEFPKTSPNDATASYATQPPKTTSEHSFVTTNGGVASPETAKPGAVMFNGPVSSSYVYRQINRSNPKPFTIVPVGNRPYTEGATSANVNDQVSSEGTKPGQENVHISPEGSSGFVFVPPPGAMDETPLPTLHKAENGKRNAEHFSYEQATRNGVYTNKNGNVDVKRDTSFTPVAVSTPKVATTERLPTLKADQDSLANHPIVVAPIQDNYSYTQNKADGSSISVQGKSGKVSVKVNEVETTSANSESFSRGDIPAAVS